MKVKCIKINNEAIDEEIGRSDGWITVGKEYEVLSMSIKESGWYIEFESNKPEIIICKELEQFEIISEDIPADWAVYYDPQIGIDITAKNPQNSSFTD